jgi:hypothetical protein
MTAHATRAPALPVGCVVNDECTALDALLAVPGQGRQIHIDPRDTLAVRFQAGQVARVVLGTAMTTVPAATGIEMPTGAHRVRSRAIAFLMDVKSVLGLRLQAPHRRTQPDTVAPARQLHDARDLAAGAGIQRYGDVAAPGC